MEDEKHGALYRQWSKVHLGIDSSTLEIRAMEVIDNSIGDAPVLPALLDQTPADEKIASVSGDRAYDTKDCNKPSPARCARHHPNATMPNLEDESLRCRGTQRHFAHDTQVGAGDLEEVERSHRRSLVQTKMAASSYWVNVSWHANLTVRSPGYRSGLLY